MNWPEGGRGARDEELEELLDEPTELLLEELMVEELLELPGDGPALLLDDESAGAVEELELVPTSIEELLEDGDGCGLPELDAPAELDEDGPALLDEPPPIGPAVLLLLLSPAAALELLDPFCGSPPVPCSGCCSWHGAASLGPHGAPPGYGGYGGYGG